MESNYRYFNRDISWLSFNHRVLLEAADPSVPLYDRINFIAIYSSNENGIITINLHFTQ